MRQLGSLTFKTFKCTSLGHSNRNISRQIFLTITSQNITVLYERGAFGQQKCCKSTTELSLFTVNLEAEFSTCNQNMLVVHFLAMLCLVS